MTAIKKIIYNLRNEKNQQMELYSSNLGMQWTLSFEFIEDSIYMMCNGLTLNGIFVDTLEDLETYLSHTFISDKNYKITLENL